MKTNYRKLLIYTFLPLLLGTIVGLLTANKNGIDSIIPAWIFPVVWTILYLLMGYSSYRIEKMCGYIPKIYYFQLIVNLLWSFIFFEFKLFTLAFIWIIFLIILVILMIKEFFKIDKLSGYLQIPYLIWLLVALGLNFMFLI